jgi:uncharacterized membrane protein
MAAVLLFVFPRVALVLTLVIISSDVDHNLWFIHRYDVAFNWMYASQVAFLVFVVVTLPCIWRSSRVRTGAAIETAPVH